jgi:hypothetical protein
MTGEPEHQRDVVDALIDEAARSLTQGAPSALLRTRVRAAIATPPLRHVLVWVPATVAVVVAVAAWFVMREAPTTPRRDGAPPVMSRSEPLKAPEPRAEPLALARLERSNTPEPQRPAVVMLSAERVTPIADPLPAIEPIEIEPVESGPMAAIERMPAPMPVEIERLEIEQLFE